MNNLLNVLEQIGAVVMMVAGQPSPKQIAVESEAFRPSYGCEYANFDVYNSEVMQRRRDLSRSECHFLND